MRLVVAAAVLAAALGAGAEPAASATCWDARVARADAYARARGGRVAFAVIDQGGRLRHRDGSAAFRTASLLKPLLLASYLRRSDVRRRPLTRTERALLDPMIRRSDNDAASAVLGRLSAAAIARTARISGRRRPPRDTDLGPVPHDCDRPGALLPPPRPCVPGPAPRVRPPIAAGDDRALRSGGASRGRGRRDGGSNSRAAGAPARAGSTSRAPGSSEVAH